MYLPKTRGQHKRNNNKNKKEVCLDVAPEEHTPRSNHHAARATASTTTTTRTTTRPRRRRGGPRDNKRKIEESEQAKLSRKEHEEEIAKLKEENAKLKEEAAKHEEKIAKIEKLRDGEFYAPFTEVWNKDDKGNFSVNDVSLLQRKKTPMVSVRVGCKEAGSFLTFENVYSLTVEKTLESIRPTRIVKDTAASSRSSTKPDVKYKLWPNDVFGNRRKGSATLPSGEIAHLVPASFENSSLYYNVAKWVFGKSDLQDFEELNKLIQGCFYEKLEGGISENEENKSKETGRRVPHVGLKHFTCNKIRLMGHGQHFDRNPNLIIVPTLSMDRILNWDGEGYDAIAMIGVKKEKKVVSLDAVASEVGFLKEGTNARDDEIEEARENLVVALKALAASLLHGDKPNNLPPERQKELETWIVPFTRGINCSKRLVLPIERNDEERRPVRKISFLAQGQNDDNGHPAPDPMLLLIKSAVNWSMYNDQQLLATGEIDDDDELSESSIFDGDNTRNEKGE